jgi:Zn-dependent alcohol dehydrogenase
MSSTTGASAQAQRAKAVVYRGQALTVEVEDIWVEPPGPGEVMIKVAACGVCHSDLSVTNGTVALAPPIVLGHEAAGVVVQVGEGVTELTVGDHVISSFVYTCGQCRQCVTGRSNLCEVGNAWPQSLVGGHARTFDATGTPLNIMASCGVMAEYATLGLGSVVKITKDVPLDRCALIGCGVMTGWGAACNTAKVQPGSVCVVFGAGGVGLSAIHGCAMSGAAMIVAVDVMDSKLEMAKVFGATHTINSKEVDNIVRTLRKLTGGGADYAFECVGFGEIIAQAFGCLRAGGEAIVVGVAPPKDQTSVRSSAFALEEKVLRGSYYGSARVRYDFPRLLALYQSGQLKLDQLITQRYGIDEAAQAFDDLAHGRNARGVIVFS